MLFLPRNNIIVYLTWFFNLNSLIQREVSRLLPNPQVPPVTEILMLPEHNPHHKTDINNYMNMHIYYQGAGPRRCETRNVRLELDRHITIHLC